ncbi:hypothetical protein A2U01_0078487, partial [Trifolium medium]|nr:hypothetical protein [Trifolium medium]
MKHNIREELVKKFMGTAALAAVRGREGATVKVKNRDEQL